MNSLSSPLGRLSGLSVLTGREREEAEQKFWRDSGGLFVTIHDKDLKPDQRSVIEQIGKDRFGGR